MGGWVGACSPVAEHHKQLVFSFPGEYMGTLTFSLVYDLNSSIFVVIPVLYRISIYPGLADIFFEGPKFHKCSRLTSPLPLWLKVVYK